jgi:PhnB protein
MARAASPVPKGYSTVTAVLTMQDTRKAIDWYEKALGAEEQSISTGPDGKVMHASIRLGTSYLMLHDEMAGSKSPRAYGGSPVELFLYVPDCDAVFKRAVDAGAEGKVPPSDQFWGDRWGVFTDPFGLSWSVATHKEDLTKDEIESRQSELFAEMVGKTG